MSYDAQATRARILEAATAEFSEYGVAGARVDRIAQRANANKRAIYDYFGGKEKLFEVVLEAAQRRIADEVPMDPADPAAYVTRLFDYQSAHPELVRLLLWEGLSHGAEGAIPGADWRSEHYAAKTGTVREAQLSGTVRDDQPPELLVFLLMAIANWNFAVPQLRRFLLGDDVAPERLRDALASVAADLLRGGASGTRSAPEPEGRTPH
ncbi:TetR/AcrR family transcriptional regulator [Nocardiopsis gilva YIM 90087]|uniref:TetR/AcrR family transcriptional regulator n=1 Tax=Nocardiopsis gilva YIM 90087 TaxID=1235441 RepID=A0A223S0J5_9ACTN|nr:TetR family transcriptional regulator [Nocardiopsis gilva]ASU81628.1 TetR/AcrR family transcriptional regulator [Nocardiopsis gilva YIM 90087]